MEQTKTDPGRKKKKPLRRCGIFFACLLFLFLCSFVYISKNPRARMLLSVIYFMQDTLKDPAYIAYHIDIMELCQDYFNGDISFEGKAYMNDIKNFNYSSSMDISGERSFTQKKLSIISDMDVLTLNVGEMDFYMNPNTVYFNVRQRIYLFDFFYAFICRLHSESAHTGVEHYVYFGGLY